jgi:hypothetical protein
MRSTSLIDESVASTAANQQSINANNAKRQASSNVSNPLTMLKQLKLMEQPNVAPFHMNPDEYR